MTKPSVEVVVAINRHRLIGTVDNRLPWHDPEDLQFFKNLTMGHPVIMGRRTWESLPPKSRPLPGRGNIVVTRDAAVRTSDTDWSPTQGVKFVATVEEAIEQCGASRVFVMGGAQIYKHVIENDLLDALYCTIVLDSEDQPEDGVYLDPAYTTWNGALEILDEDYWSRIRRYVIRRRP